MRNRNKLSNPVSPPNVAEGRRRVRPPCPWSCAHVRVPWTQAGGRTERRYCNPSTLIGWRQLPNPRANPVTTWVGIPAVGWVGGPTWVGSDPLHGHKPCCKSWVQTIPYGASRSSAPAKHVIRLHERFERLIVYKYPEGDSALRAINRYYPGEHGEWRHVRGFGL
jgi:hypothetical protein